MSIKVNKAKLNLTIDIIMFVVLMAIAGIGFMIKYVLIPGFKRNEIYGKDVELYFWGLDRHQWGTIHLTLSFTLLFLLLLHIIFHWNQIVCIFKRMVSPRTWCIALTSAFVFISLVFGVLPLFIKPEIQAGDSHHFNKMSQVSRNSIQGSSLSFERILEQSRGEFRDTITFHNSKVELSRNISGNNYSHKQRELHNIEIYGYMTLNEVAEKYNISVIELASYIHVPKVYTSEKLGRLRKQYDFQMGELRNYIESKNEME